MITPRMEQSRRSLEVADIKLVKVGFRVGMWDEANNDGCSHTEIVWREIVIGSQPDGTSGVDTDNPCEIQEIVDHAKQHGHLAERDNWSQHCLHEFLSIVPALPLLHAD